MDIVSDTYIRGGIPQSRYCSTCAHYQALSGSSIGGNSGGSARACLYILARARIYFADEHIACDYCPCLETYSRKQCRLTGEYLIDTRTIGYNCPLEFEPEGGETT